MWIHYKNHSISIAPNKNGEEKILLLFMIHIEIKLMFVCCLLLSFSLPWSTHVRPFVYTNLYFCLRNQEDKILTELASANARIRTHKVELGQLDLNVVKLYDVHAFAISLDRFISVSIAI